MKTYTIHPETKRILDWVLQWSTSEEPRATEWDNFWNGEFPPYAEKLQLVRDKERAVLRGNVMGKLK